MLKIEPYLYVYTTYVKQRWLDRSLVDVLTNEFKDYTEDYFKNAVLCGIIQVLRKGVLISQVSDVCLMDSDIIIHFTHRHEAPIFQRPVVAASNLAYFEEQILDKRTLSAEQLAHAVVYDAVYKPAGMPVHPVSHYCKNTLVNHVQAKFVNRLDRLVSGLMLSAASSAAAEALRERFEGRRVVKMYCARVSNPSGRSGCYAVYGDVEYDQCNARICTETGCFVALDSSEQAKRLKQQGFQALSFAIIKNNCAMCYPYTGRTHQLRIHLQQLGCPIINDPLYGGQVEQVLEQIYDIGASEQTEVYRFEKHLCSEQLAEALKQLKGLRHLCITDIVAQLYFPDNAECYTCKRINEHSSSDQILEHRNGRLYITNYYRYIQKELYLSCVFYLIEGVPIEGQTPQWFNGDAAALRQQLIALVL